MINNDKLYQLEPMTEKLKEVNTSLSMLLDNHKTKFTDIADALLKLDFSEISQLSINDEILKTYSTPKLDKKYNNDLVKFFLKKSSITYPTLSVLDLFLFLDLKDDKKNLHLILKHFKKCFANTVLDIYPAAINTIKGRLIIPQMLKYNFVNKNETIAYIIYLSDYYKKSRNTSYQDYLLNSVEEKNKNIPYILNKIAHLKKRDMYVEKQKFMQENNKKIRKLKKLVHYCYEIIERNKNLIFPTLESFDIKLVSLKTSVANFDLTASGNTEEKNKIYKDIIEYLTVSYEKAAILKNIEIDKDQNNLTINKKTFKV